MIATVLLASETGHKYGKVNFVIVCFIYIVWFSMYVHVHVSCAQIRIPGPEFLHHYEDINRAYMQFTCSPIRA